ncbi:NUDIX hydrolase [Thaumasiovibrio subtropicus]|uniref:NUDIX hydrolase n=1 Tax=Thaumasiovibrio subtropicus TaxID=1891207 RepID=UPI000B35363A|nr:NUDIX domain-containing protein [Thaumasiovibrio subtropicus]
MFCPRCGASTFERESLKSFLCKACGFTYFQNAATAVAAIIIAEGEMLIAERAREPGKGMWDLPGGFVDYDEPLETALQRELQEELGWHTDILQYIGSQPNVYPYKGITYHTCDCFFLVELDAKPEHLKANDDVASLRWVAIEEINLDKFAFQSIRSMLETLLTSS